MCSRYYYWYYNESSSLIVILTVEGQDCFNFATLEGSTACYLL